MSKRRPKRDRRPRSQYAVTPERQIALRFEPLEDRRLLTGVPELLAQINAGGSSNPAEFVSSAGLVFFRATDGTNGAELWKTDGTTAGTMLVKDIRPSSPGSLPEFLTDVAGTLFFVADDGTNGAELWKSDGTPGGTVMVKNINPDGSASPGNLTNVGGTLYFRADNGTNGAELWKSDGTPGGTVMVMDINTSGGSDPNYLTEVGGRLFFVADDGATGAELWISDPGTTSTTLVKDISLGPSSSSPGFFDSMTNVGGMLYFSAFDAANGFELWKSNGTPGGTELVKDIRPGANSSFPFVMANVGGTLFFTATDGASGFELWKSDGTSGGTELVKDINATPGVGSNPDGLVNMNGTLYFRADGGANGVELWKSDGSSAGTTMVLDINPAGSSSPRYLTNTHGTLYFRATDATNGTELWRSNGLPGGTSLVANLAPGSESSDPQNLANIGGTLFFSAQDGANNHQPWVVRPASANVVGTHLFYNNSAFDGNSAAANGNDDSAVATDKVAYLPGTGTATFANVSAYVKGINGVMIDLAGPHGELSAADFTLRTGSSNTPENWPLAPAPASVTVRYGAGASGSDRVELIWVDGAIEKTWLGVTIKSNSNTNLPAPHTFFFGNHTGETGLGNNGGALSIDSTDEIATRFNQGEALAVTSVFDFNRDMSVDPTDQIITRFNQGFLLLLNVSSSAVAGRYLFYNASAFDNFSAGVDVTDDNAIATDKSAYLAGGGLATFDNITSYAHGINGIMIDLSGSHPNITAADFTFKVGDSNTPGDWVAAPAPTTVLVRASEGTGGSDRVELIWANGAIANTWLEVTLAANGNTGLATPDVFFFGSRIGDTGSDADPSATITDIVDQVEVRFNQGSALSVTNLYDFDRNATVDPLDEIIARFNSGFTLLINVAAAPDPPAAALAASGSPSEAIGDDVLEGIGEIVDAIILDDELLDDLLSERGG